MVLDQELASSLVGRLFKLPEQLGHLGRIEIVNGKPLVHSQLDGMSHSWKSIPKLILDLAQPGIQEGRVAQDELEQHAPQLVEAVPDSNIVLGEFLNHF